MCQFVGSWRSLLFAAAVLISLFAAPNGQAVCISYSVVAAPPPVFNWTDTAQWTPSGFPGSLPCDDASNNTNNTAIVVDSVLPNAIANLILSCSSCEIDIVGGGQLTVDTGGTIGSGATIVVDGGTFNVNASGIYE
jgi:hypothetical protein